MLYNVSRRQLRTLLTFIVGAHAVPYRLVLCACIIANQCYVVDACRCPSWTVIDGRRYECPDCSGTVSMINNCVTCLSSPLECLQPCDGVIPLSSVSSYKRSPVPVRQPPCSQVGCECSASSSFPYSCDYCIPSSYPGGRCVCPGPWDVGFVSTMGNISWVAVSAIGIQNDIVWGGSVGILVQGHTAYASSLAVQFRCTNCNSNTDYLIVSLRLVNHTMGLHVDLGTLDTCRDCQKYIPLPYTGRQYANLEINIHAKCDSGWFDPPCSLRIQGGISLQSSTLYDNPGPVTNPIVWYPAASITPPPMLAPSIAPIAGPNVHPANPHADRESRILPPYAIVVIVLFFLVLAIVVCALIVWRVYCAPRMGSQYGTYQTEPLVSDL